MRDDNGSSVLVGLDEVLWTWNGHRVPCCPWRLRYGRGSRHLWLLRGTTRQIFRSSPASVSFTVKDEKRIDTSSRDTPLFFCLNVFLAYCRGRGNPIQLFMDRIFFLGKRDDGNGCSVRLNSIWYSIVFE